MPEKHIYNWQTLGRSEDFLIQVDKLAKDSYWQIAQNGDDIVFRPIGFRKLLSEKLRSYSDQSRRQSKRLNDFADIVVLIESHPELWEYLPEVLKSKISRQGEIVTETPLAL